MKVVLAHLLDSCCDRPRMETRSLQACSIFTQQRDNSDTTCLRADLMRKHVRCCLRITGKAVALKLKPSLVRCYDHSAATNLL